MTGSTETISVRRITSTLQTYLRKTFYACALSPLLTRVLDRWNQSSKMNLGQRGELEAERFFLRRGCFVVARGYSDKFGEIDLIVVEDRTVVFVEVKTRSNDEDGLPAEAVDESKQAKITRTAQGFLKWQNLTECRVRFDVVSIVWNRSESRLQHFPAAFEASGKFQIF